MIKTRNTTLVTSNDPDVKARLNHPHHSKKTMHYSAKDGSTQLEKKHPSYQRKFKY